MTLTKYWPIDADSSGQTCFKFLQTEKKIYAKEVVGKFSAGLLGKFLTNIEINISFSHEDIKVIA